ncbi:MAG: RtcB family protein, partial [Candidatus Micrarchaeia archaeon]
MNCGVRLLKTNLTEKDVKPKLKQLINALFENIPTGVGSKSKLRLDRQQLEDATHNGSKWAIEQGLGVENDSNHCEESGAIPLANFSKVSQKAQKRGFP